MSLQTLYQTGAGTDNTTAPTLPSTPTRCENSKDNMSPAQRLKHIALHASARKGHTPPPAARHPFGVLNMNTTTTNAGATNSVSDTNIKAGLSTKITVTSDATRDLDTEAKTASKSILKHTPSVGATLSAPDSWRPTTHHHPLVRTTRRRPTKREVLYETPQPRYPPPVKPSPSQLSGHDEGTDQPPQDKKQEPTSYAAQYLAGQVPPPSLPRTGYPVVPTALAVDPERSMSEDVARALAGMYGLLTISSSGGSREFGVGAEVLEPGALTATPLV